jgi:hypothetical protein
MRTIFLFSFFLIQLTSIAQWSEFNRAHPVSCQWAPYNYLAQGYLENIFVVDTNPNFYDGYLCFGLGILCNPDSADNYRRLFSCKTNTAGELMFWNRYDNDSIDLNENWFFYYSPSHGGMCQNNNNEIVSIYSTSIGFGEVSGEINYLVGLNDFGDLIWKYLIDASADRFGFSQIIQNSNDSTYMSVGWFQDSVAVLTNQTAVGSLMKIDQQGNMQWHTEYDDVLSILKITEAADGGYWLIGSTPILGDCGDGWYKNYDIVILKIDNGGNENGRMVLGGQCGREVAQIFEMSDGKIMLTGRVTTQDYFPQYGTYFGYSFSTIIEQGQNGNIVELGPQKQYLQTFEGIFNLTLESNDNGYFIVEDNYIEVPNDQFTFYKRVGTILKINSERDSIWSHHYSYYDSPPPIPSIQPAEHYISDAKCTVDGGVVCCGYVTQGYYDPNPNLQTPWIFKVDSMGCLEPGCQYVNIEEIVIGLENTVSVFPNPASDIVNLTFTFPENFVPNNQNELVIIDMQGREVLRQSISLFASQNNQIQINISSLSSGVYTLHWISNNAWLDSTKLVVD